MNDTDSEITIYYHGGTPPERHESAADPVFGDHGVEFQSVYGATVIVPWTAIQKIEIT